MNTVDALPEQSSNPTIPRGHRTNRGGARGRGPRRGRGGARPSTEAPRTDNGAQLPAEGLAPSSEPVTISSQGQSAGRTNADNSDPRRGQTRRNNRRGGRGDKRGGNPGTQTHVDPSRQRNLQVGGRAFGGKLTREGREGGPIDQADPSSIQDGDEQELRADVPDFVPGKSLDAHATRTTSTKSSNKSRDPRLSAPKITTKSTANDIATRTHEDIAHGLYECPICTSELGRKSRVWSCHRCWTVFHLSCVKKWSKNEGSVFQNSQGQRSADDGTTTPRQWRCPGCNLPQDSLPKVYSCWCEKEVDPRPLAGIPPHSCGQTCSRNREACPHPCDQTCHAGPCPPCTAMGPTQDCFCGKSSSTKRCIDTDYVNGWSCGQVCGDLLPCGKHTCPRPCHEGFCGACTEKVEARCYCGKVDTEILCSALEDELHSERLSEDESTGKQDLETWTGSFKCAETCNRPFDCGVHFCQKDCHPQEGRRAHCPRSPDVVSHCPCGKTRLSEIKGFTERSSCEDPIPNCAEPCGKVLSCGHLCTSVCHTGDCSPCYQKVTITCRCGRNTFPAVCSYRKIEPPQCLRICKAGMNCGRHTCAEHCCTGERKAVERQATKRKLRSLNAVPNRPMDDDIEAEHICTRICGRMLKCGRHTCPELCHKGPCGTCREAIFEEVSCHCGRSVLYPPLPCGTKPPPCRFECERIKPCGHPQTPHNCHPDDENCPKCAFLTEKNCLCGKKLLKNQPCWLTDARCGLICGKPLKCGSHTCLKPCHRPGECEDAAGPCQQPCGKTKKLCGHPCTEPCHAPYACSEKTPCQTMITLTCACGRLRQEKRCNAARAVASKGHVQQPEVSPAPISQLKCDDECARLERNRSLASALNIDIDSTTTLAANASPHNMSVSNLPYSAETLDMYVQLSASSTLTTLQDYETTLHGLAVSTTQRSVRFQPARAPLRAFIHSLAADWGFASESFDPEPHRHVFVLKPHQWSPPVFGIGSTTTIGIGGMTVGECVRFRERERFKEREAQRVAAAEAKALKQAAKSVSTGEGGWAQVASRSKKLDGQGSDVVGHTPFALARKTVGGGSIYSALAGIDGKNRPTNDPAAKKGGRLVLRSVVGAGKGQVGNSGVGIPALSVDDVADSWEEQEEKEEEEEARKSLEREKAADTDVVVSVPQEEEQESAAIATGGDLSEVHAT